MTPHEAMLLLAALFVSSILWLILDAEWRRPGIELIGWSKVRFLAALCVFDGAGLTLICALPYWITR